MTLILIYFWMIELMTEVLLVALRVTSQNSRLYGPMDAVLSPSDSKVDWCRHRWQKHKNISLVPLCFHIHSCLLMPKPPGRTFTNNFLLMELCHVTCPKTNEPKLFCLVPSNKITLSNVSKLQ